MCDCDYDQPNVFKQSNVKASMPHPHYDENTGVWTVPESEAAYAEGYRNGVKWGQAEVSDWQKYGGKYVGCNPVEVGKAAEQRIIELETALDRIAHAPPPTEEVECGTVDAWLRDVARSALRRTVTVVHKARRG